MKPLLLVLLLLPLAAWAQTTEVVGCEPGTQTWVLRVAGPPLLPHVCLVQLLVHRQGCAFYVQYSTPHSNPTAAQDCAWLQLVGHVSERGDSVVLSGPAAPHHGAGKWTLSALSRSNLYLTNPDGYSVLYMVLPYIYDNGGHFSTRKLMLFNKRI